MFASVVDGLLMQGLVSSAEQAVVIAELRCGAGGH